MAGEEIEDTDFFCLLFRAALGAPGGSRDTCEVKGGLAFVGDAVADDALEFGTQGEHCSENFTDWGKVVVGDPAAEAEEVGIENCRRIEDADDILRGDIRLAVVKFCDDAGHALLAEGDEDASADDWSEACG